MPYDPALPPDAANLIAAVLRGQFAGLKALLDALAAGTVTAVLVDAVNTVAPGSPAGVAAQVTGNTLHLTFSIPQGNDGAQGLPGMTGNDGPQGTPGAQGEVSLAQLNTAITDALAAAAAAAAANSSANSNGVATLNGPFADPDSEALRVKVNELLTALRR